MKAFSSLAIIALITSAASAQRAAPAESWEMPGTFAAVLGGANAPVTDAPFSAIATIDWQGILPSGQSITRQQEVAIYRDSAGRVRIERGARHSSTPDATDSPLITIDDPVARCVYQLNATTRMGLRTPIDSAASPPASLDGPSRLSRNSAMTPDVQTTGLGTQTISGLTATGTRTTITFAADALGTQAPLQIVRDEWVAPALHLAVLTTSPDPDGGRNVTRLTNIEQREPDPALFQVPAGYVVRSWPNLAWRGARSRS